MHWIKAENEMKLGLERHLVEKEFRNQMRAGKRAAWFWNVKWSSATIWGLIDKQEQIHLGLQYAKEPCDRLLAKCSLISPILFFLSPTCPFQSLPKFSAFLYIQINKLKTVFLKQHQIYEDIRVILRRRGGFPGGSDSKESARSVGDSGSITGSERSPGEGNDNPLQFSCLENPMDRGAW